MPVNFQYQKKATIRFVRDLQKFIQKIFTTEQVEIYNIDYIFCSDRYLLSLNQKHMNHNYYTDILTFNLQSIAYQPIMAEIYISVDMVKYNAERYNFSFQQELRRVIFHGALHLCGYKDLNSQQKKLMTQKEDEYLKMFHVEHKL